MEQGIGISQRHQTASEQEQWHFQEGLSSGKGYRDNNTDTPVLEEEGPDNPADTDGYDEEEPQSTLDEDEPFFVQTPVHPLWLLCGGQLIWAASDFGIHAQQREYFRRRIQMLLDFLAREFPKKKPEELLLALRGFFVRINEDNKKNKGDREKGKKSEKTNEPPAPGRWLDFLSRAGIVYGKDKILPLRSLRVENGRGKSGENFSTSLPEGIEYLWLEEELPKHKEDKPLFWANCKGWLPEGLDAFAKKINAFCEQHFVREQIELNNGTENQGLGLANVVFSYDTNIEKEHDNSIQHHKLSPWKKWWGQKLQTKGTEEGKE